MPNNVVRQLATLLALSWPCSLYPAGAQGEQEKRNARRAARMILEDAKDKIISQASMGAPAGQGADNRAANCTYLYF